MGTSTRSSSRQITVRRSGRPSSQPTFYQPGFSQFQPKITVKATPVKVTVVKLKRKKKQQQQPAKHDQGHAVRFAEKSSTQFSNYVSSNPEPYNDKEDKTTEDIKKAHRGELCGLLNHLTVPGPIRCLYLDGKDLKFTKFLEKHGTEAVKSSIKHVTNPFHWESMRAVNTTANIFNLFIGELQRGFCTAKVPYDMVWFDFTGTFQGNQEMLELGMSTPEQDVIELFKYKSLAPGGIFSMTVSLRRQGGMTAAEIVARVVEIAAEHNFYFERGIPLATSYQGAMLFIRGKGLGAPYNPSL